VNGKFALQKLDKLKKSNKVILGVFIGIGVLALLLVVVNNILESKIQKGIEKNLDAAKASYEKVDVELLDRSAEVINASIILDGKQLKVDTIRLDDIEIFEYISNKNIIIGNLKISKPEVSIYKLEQDEKKSSKSNKQNAIKNKIRIKLVEVLGGSLKIFEKDSTSHRLYSKIKNIRLEQVRIDSSTLKESVPFNYDLILLNIDSIFYDLNDLQKLYAGDLVIRDNDLRVKDLHLKPKFSRSEHQQNIRKETDWYDLEIDSIGMKEFTWNLVNDSLKIGNQLTQMDRFKLVIYRDKLQPDDESIKPLYSQMLREMPVLLEIDSISLSNGYLRYEEKLRENREPGVVDFTNLNFQISHFGNTGLDRENFPETVIHAQANFMEAAALNVNWTFNVGDTQDRFQIKGELGRIAAEQINEFMKPAMNVQAHGEIEDLYFNFSGDPYNAIGDMRLEYKDFKIEVLQKDGKQKNKVVSALANLIVKNSAQNSKANHQDITVERDRTKSFWNYLWNMIKNGALKAFI